MAELPKSTFRAAACMAIARFLMRNRRPFALLLALTTGFAVYPLVNTVLFLAGHRLPGPIVLIHLP